MSKEQKQHNKKIKGFTLIETMVGMAVWAILLMCITTSIPSIMIVSQKSRAARNANSVASNQIEYLRTMSYSDIQDNLLSSSPIKKSVVQNNVSYNVTTTISKFDISGSSDNALEIDVVVEWSLGNNIKQNTSTWTLFTKSGLSDKQFIEAS